MKPHLKIITIATMLIAMIIIGPNLVKSQNGWSGAMPVSDGDASLGDDELAVAVNGQNAYTVWEANEQFTLSTLQSGAWSADRIISNFEGYRPTLTADNNGHLHLAWANRGSLMTSYSTDNGQTWSEAEQLDSYSEAPILVTGGDGLLYLAWRRNYGVKVAHSSNGGQSWSAGQWSDFSSNPECSGGWTLAATSNGAVLAYGEAGEISIQQISGSGPGAKQQVYYEDNCSSGPSKFAIGDDGQQLYLVWGGLNLTRSSDSGASWSSPQSIEPGIGGSNDFQLVAGGSGQVWVAHQKSGFVYVYESSDSGQNWQSSSFGPVEDEFALAVDPQSGLGVVVWDGLSNSGIYAATKYLTGQPPVLLTGATLNDANQPLANTHLIITPQDGSPTIDVFADAEGNFETELPSGQYTFTPHFTGYHFEPPSLIADVPLVDPPQFSGTKLGQIISVRALDDTTVGVVGFINRNYVTTATLKATNNGQETATVDIFPLAEHNAPGGGQNRTIPETAGLWSATLSAAQFDKITLNVSEADGPTHIFSANRPGPGEELALQNIKKGSDGKVDISGQITAGADSLTLSHWQRPDAAAGIAWPGWWNEEAYIILPDGQWAFEGVDTQDGENLYRVQTPDGLEDIDGYYYVGNTEMELHTEETHQRKQALVFRDAVREVLAAPKDDYGTIFPNQLILAVGAQENGTFNNALEFPIGRHNGIMQVTTYSAFRGQTECGQNESCYESYQYRSNAQSIKYNVKDALLGLNDEAYRVAGLELEDCDKIYDENGEADQLITSIIYNNTWCNFVKQYSIKTSHKFTETVYLKAIASQLRHNPPDGNSLPPPLEGQNISLAEFFVNADYIAETSDLAERLEWGQINLCNQIRQYLELQLAEGTDLRNQDLPPVCRENR